MPEVRVLHMADLHLEWPFGSTGAGGRQSLLRREELKAVFAGIIDLAASEGVQVMLLAGDLYEHAHVTRGTVKFMDDQFRRIPDVRIFISPGNHDPYLEGSYWQTYPWAPNVHVFGPEPDRVDLPDLPVSVYGWGFGTWEVRSWQLGALAAGTLGTPGAPGGLRSADPGRVNLAVFHGGDEAYHPFGAAELESLRMDYIALGHIHKTGTVLETGGRVIARYSGSPEALSFGEPGEHGVWLGTVSRESARMTFVPTGRRRYVTADVDLSGAVSVEDVVQAVLKAVPPADRAQHCYRLALTGSVDPGLALDTGLLEEMLAGQFYLLRLQDRTELAYDLEALARERSARGLFVQRLLAMESQAADDEAAQRRIRRALALGLGAFAGKGGGL